MKTSPKIPTITKKYPIEVPTQTYESVASVFRINFGKHYLIWKGKYLLQACQFVAENIERYIRLQKNNKEDHLHHVAAHVKKTRCLSATVKVLENEFTKGDAGTVDAYKLLMAEQKWLDDAIGDPYCLNNNAQAYVPRWMPEHDKNKFLKYYESTDEKRQKKINKKVRA